MKTRKKLTAAFIGLLLMVFFTGQLLGQTCTIKVGSRIKCPVDTVLVPVKFYGFNQPNVGGITIVSIQFPDTNILAYRGVTPAPQFSSGWTSNYSQTTRRFNIAWSSLIPVVADSGILCYLKFMYKTPAIANITFVNTNMLITDLTDTIAYSINFVPGSISSGIAGMTATASPNPVCLGSSLTLSGSGTGVTSWNWSGPAGFSSTAQNPVITNVTTYNAGIYTLSATNSCGASTATVNVVINAQQVPAVIISASPSGPVNYGTHLVFTAAPVNGGSAPVFQWTLNGSIVGVNAATYSNDSLANGDLICCTMTSNAPCASPVTAADCDTAQIIVPGFILAGQVFAGLLPIDNGNSTLSVINGQSISQAGWMNFDTLGYYFFMQQPPASYYVKCEPSSTSSVFGQFSPTYYGDELNWSNATIIYLNMDLFGEDIHLLAIPGSNPGQGQIGGNIQQGAKGGPLAGIEILLMDNTGNALTYANSDQWGGFSFNGIAYGTYIIYPEIAGKTTIPASITISAADPSATNLVFTVNSDNVVAGVEVEEATISFISEIFPNPVNENSAIRLGVKNPAGMQMQVFDITGRLLSDKHTELTTGENEISIDHQNLASGVYQLVMHLDDGRFFSKAFVK